MSVTRVLSSCGSSTEYAREWLSSQASWLGCAAGLILLPFPGYYSKLHPPFHSLGKTPDETIAWARGEDADKHEILDAIQGYVNGMHGRYRSKKFAYAVARSFFMHNRADLPQDCHFLIRADETPVGCNLKHEHVRRVVNIAESRP